MKRLYRSEKDRMLGGVLAGIAEYFNIDPTIVRLLFVVLFFVTNIFLLVAYVIAIFIIPNESGLR
ncbi:phage shock protein C (PspC) family protein [Oceanobacillus limi]|uniref:Phage shock protein C (PspC) family protein n=1 Tax=Oceanobacillus limi TaxID=930131 RepID=A0A1I0BU73_9BACI|nr:PspC domain-containing protein [Oceanobacillus limi]SET10168.1 phage shock protein C (PspC) family protein [Oceanobacillus limi]